MLFPLENSTKRAAAMQLTKRVAALQLAL